MEIPVQEKSSTATHPNKIVIVGDVGVGKTSIVHRFVNDKFNFYPDSTIGASFFSCIVTHKNVRHKFDLWDTAGQERYQSLVPLYCRGADVAIITYSITSAKSFSSAVSWISKMRNDHPEIIIVLCGNKIDRLDKCGMIHKSPIFTQVVSQVDLYMEVSAKTGTNIRQMFRNIAEIIPSPSIAKKSLDLEKKNKKNSKSCYC